MQAYFGIRIFECYLFSCGRDKNGGGGVWWNADDNNTRSNPSFSRREPENLTPQPPKKLKKPEISRCHETAEHV